MKKQISVVAGLLLVGNVNIGILRAQPLANTALAPALTKAQLNVQRAEASAQTLAFATETLRSQSPADFARLPVALRDALPYWLEFQPFEAWSPELQQFAKGHFQKLATDAQVENYASAAKNKAAVVQWMQEKAPFENAQLRFYLAIRTGLIGKNLDGVTVLETAEQVSMAEYDTPRMIAFGRFINSLLPQQKSDLFANNMHLSMAALSPEQKQYFEAFQGGADTNIDTPNGQISMRQSPKSEIVLDFKFVAIVQRNIADKKDDFYVQIARPFDYSRR